nr:HEAT repeat domain-containing protein [uncultured Lacibacter sp.]
MPTLVHLADERDAPRILKNGIKPGKYRTGVFCMPVLQNFYVTHQWLRELKRRGVNNFVGIYFKVDNTQMVYAGKYNHQHRYITLGAAVKDIMSMNDPLGYELIIDRKIEPGEITKIKALSQTIGWRYRPDAHGTKPCPCDYCIRTDINANKLRERLRPREKTDDYQTLLQKIKVSRYDDEIVSLLYEMQRKKRRSDPQELVTLFKTANASVVETLVATLGYFRHKNTAAILRQFLLHEHSDVRERSAESLLMINREKGLQLLQQYTHDAVLQKLLEEEMADGPE